MEGKPTNGFRGWREAAILLASGLLALSPYLAYRGLFARLYWFGDEFDMIDEIDRLGFWRWAWLIFGQNLVPVFKVLWGGAVFLFGGSYAAMIALVWLTHALNVALFGRLMRTCGLPWAAVFLAQALFGLTSANLETLAWSVQVSAMLSVTFMLLAMDGLFRARPLWEQLAWSAASALSIARGVLVGPVLALGTLLGRGEGEPAPLWNRARRVAVLLVPSLIVAAVIAKMATGNHQHMEGHWTEAGVFALWYYCANPAHYLLSVEPYGWHTVVVLGLVKLALVGWAITQSRGRTRVLFLLLVAFELGNSVLLGIGRFDIGIGSTLSSRYQYASLLCVVPMAGYWFAMQCRRIPGPPAAGRAVAAAVILSLGFCMVRNWAGVLEPFTASRGTESRRILLLDPASKRYSVPGIPGLEIDRARLLIDKYRLH